MYSQVTDSTLLNVMALCGQQTACSSVGDPQWGSRGGSLYQLGTGDPDGLESQFPVVSRAGDANLQGKTNFDGSGFGDLGR
jgi:hypothetical protein